MNSRRHFLNATGALTAAGLSSGLSLTSQAAGGDYRALVVLHLNGGNDGNNLLVPTDGAYADYEESRQNLALPRRGLTSLPGSAAGHTFGLHASLTPLAPLYAAGRLAFLANVGPLIEPATAGQVLANAVRLPPFLMSHNDQAAMVQGWTADEDNSGWAGRGLEALPGDLRNAISAITMDTNRTLVLGKRSAVSFMPPGGNSQWGPANLAQPGSSATQAIGRMAKWQFANAYEAEYARTFGNGLVDSVRFTQAFQAAPTPAADFGTDNLGNLGNNLRALASVLPMFKAQGLRRQVFLVHWGGFDTHANQRGAGTNTQDAQLGVLAQALAAFDATNLANGMDGNVVTVAMSEFGRTLRPGSGGGSEHAWGNHWMALGGPVAGGTVHGRFPSLALGGPDDGDPGRNGRHVPTMSSDQVGATLMQWLGLPSSRFAEVFPNLANFSTPTVPFLRA